MSILMQAEDSGTDDTLCQSVTLPLAERMVAKFADEGKMVAEEEVQLYLMILEKQVTIRSICSFRPSFNYCFFIILYYFIQKKFKEAFEVLQGSLAGKHLSLRTIETKTGNYLRQLGQWDRLLDHYEALLGSDADQWSHYEGYIEAALACSPPAVDRAKELIFSKTMASVANAPLQIRGPYLGRLLLWRELDRKGLDAASLLGGARFGPLVDDYVRVLGDKPCAFLDLRPFLECLRTADEVDQLLQCTGRLAGVDDDQESSPKDVKQLCRHLLHLQLAHYLGRHEQLSPRDKVQLAEELWAHYRRTEFLSAGLLSTDFGPNDGYALLAAHLLLDAWGEGETGELDKCLLLLETALKNSPANYHLKLLAVRVYTLAGHGRAALERYETLDVKYIQLDSLGHLLCRPLISMGLPQSASPLLSSTLRFFTSHARETAECLITAYKFGSFAKIPEFTRFGRRLDGSVHFAAATAERMLLDLLTDSGTSQAGLVAAASGMHADPYLDQPDWAACFDNRDCDVFVAWDPPSK